MKISSRFKKCFAALLVLQVFMLAGGLMTDGLLAETPAETPEKEAAAPSQEARDLAKKNEDPLFYVAEPHPIEPVKMEDLDAAVLRGVQFLLRRADVDQMKRVLRAKRTKRMTQIAPHKTIRAGDQNMHIFPPSVCIAYLSIPIIQEAPFPVNSETKRCS